MCGCRWTSTSVRTDAVTDSVSKVVQRHDSYTAEPSELAESSALLILTKKKSISRSVFRAKLTPVANRHDKFINEDGSLSPIQKRTYLRTTKLLREIAHERRE